MIITGSLRCISTARPFPNHSRIRFLLGKCLRARDPAFIDIYPARIIISGHRCWSSSMIREWQPSPWQGLKLTQQT